MKPDEKEGQSEEIKAFIVFGDIRRSMSWLRRPSSTLEQKELLGKIRREIDSFEAKYNYQIKRAADGFICVMEVFRENKKCQAVKILKRFHELCLHINLLIKKSPYPRPEGYRIRFMVGNSFREKLTGPDGFISYDECKKCVNFHKMEWFDYIGYSPHLCHRLLSVRKDIPCIVHESVKDILNPTIIKKYGLHFKELTPVPPTPDEVDEEDMHLLYILTVGKNGKS